METDTVKAENDDMIRRLSCFPLVVRSLEVCIILILIALSTHSFPRFAANPFCAFILVNLIFLAVVVKSPKDEDVSFDENYEWDSIVDFQTRGKVDSHGEKLVPSVEIKEPGKELVESEILKQRRRLEISVTAPRCRELRRSKTASEIEDSKKDVEELSSEEFRLTVEAFIERNKLFMKKETNYS